MCSSDLLDADTTGITLFAKSAGALRAFSELFEERRVEKYYLAVVHGIPKQAKWTCNLPLQPELGMKGRMMIARKPTADAKDAETHFQVVNTTAKTALIEAHPTTGRTHQIRVHLHAAGHSVLGDTLYGPEAGNNLRKLALRATELSFRDPFQRRPIRIQAPTVWFLRDYGFPEPAPPPKP